MDKLKHPALYILQMVVDKMDYISDIQSMECTWRVIFIFSMISNQSA